MDPTRVALYEEFKASALVDTDDFMAGSIGYNSNKYYLHDHQRKNYQIPCRECFTNRVKPRPISKDLNTLVTDDQMDHAYQYLSRLIQTNGETLGFHSCKDACSKPNIGKESDLQSEPVGLSLAFHCSHLMIRHSQKYENLGEMVHKLWQSYFRQLTKPSSNVLQTLFQQFLSTCLWNQVDHPFSEIIQIGLLGFCLYNQIVKLTSIDNGENDYSLNLQRIYTLAQYLMVNESENWNQINQQSTFISMFNHFMQGNVAFTLVLVAKYPIPGKSKTRLHPSCGTTGASELAEAFLKDLLQRFGQISTIPSLCRVLLYAPQDKKQEMQNLVDIALPDRTKAWTLLSMINSNELQSSNLGPKLSNALERIHQNQWGPVVFIGMDTPQLKVEELSRALDFAVTKDRAYICPANDGGYVLLSLPSRCSGQVFEHVSWSQANTFSSQLQSLQSQGFSVHIGPEYLDIDTPDDLMRFKDHLLYQNKQSLPHTAAILNKHELEKADACQ